MLYEGFTVLFRHSFNLAALQAKHCPSRLVGSFILKTGLGLQVEEISSDSPFLRPALLGKQRQLTFFHIFPCLRHFLCIQYRDLSLSPSTSTRWSSRHPELLHHCFVNGHLSSNIMWWLYWKHALLLHDQLPLIYHHIYCRSIMGSDLCFHLFLCLKETSAGLILLLSCSSTERRFFAAFQPEFSSKQSKSPSLHGEKHY